MVNQGYNQYRRNLVGSQPTSAPTHPSQASVCNIADVVDYTLPVFVVPMRFSEGLLCRRSPDFYPQFPRRRDGMRSAHLFIVRVSKTVAWVLPQHRPPNMQLRNQLRNQYLCVHVSRRYRPCQVLQPSLTALLGCYCEMQLLFSPKAIPFVI